MPGFLYPQPKARKDVQPFLQAPHEQTDHVFPWITLEGNNQHTAILALKSSSKYYVYISIFVLDYTIDLPEQNAAD